MNYKKYIKYKLKYFDLKNNNQSGGNEELVSIASTNNIDKVREYLENNQITIDINYKDRHGFTALMYACVNNNLQIAELLLSHNADINVQFYGGDTALFRACKSYCFDMVNLLLDKGADINFNPGGNNI